jgi:hypothetical protein
VDLGALGLGVIVGLWDCGIVSIVLIDRFWFWLVGCQG